MTEKSMESTGNEESADARARRLRAANPGQATKENR
jgi:hypothetical protein